MEDYKSYIENIKIALISENIIIDDEKLNNEELENTYSQISSINKILLSIGSLNSINIFETSSEIEKKEKEIIKEEYIEEKQETEDEVKFNRILDLMKKAREQQNKYADEMKSESIEADDNVDINEDEDYEYDIEEEDEDEIDYENSSKEVENNIKINEEDLDEEIFDDSNDYEEELEEDLDEEIFDDSNDYDNKEDIDEELENDEELEDDEEDLEDDEEVEEEEQEEDLDEEIFDDSNDYDEEEYDLDEEYEDSEEYEDDEFNEDFDENEFIEKFNEEDNKKYNIYNSDDGITPYYDFSEELNKDTLGSNKIKEVEKRKNNYTYKDSDFILAEGVESVIKKTEDKVKNLFNFKKKGN